MARNHWEELDAPLADHVLQAALYAWMLDRADWMHDPVDDSVVRECSQWRAHPTVVLLYVAKDWVRGSPYKEFHIDTNSFPVRNMLNLALDRAAEVRDAADRSGVPAREICAAQDCTRARNCPTATLCFNLPEGAT